MARHSTTSDPTPAPMFTPSPLRHVSPASKEELEKAGFDSLEGSSIRYPANEYLRQFEVFIADTFQTFKKTPTHKVGRVIVTTPQTIEKIVESDSPVVSDIRCVVLCLDASENLRITKYKNVVGSLTLKNILFRVILVTPSVPSTSRKLGPLRKRQQTITSLLISQWIEPPACDLVFRNNAVPLGLSVEYIENVEVLSETRSFIEKWLERTVIFLESLNDLFPLPSTKPQDLFLIDWTQISARANSCADDTLQLVVNCMFLVESARNLIVHGPRVFYLYCVDLLGNAEKDSRASNLALMILGDPVLSKVYEKIQAKYSYKTDSIFDISFCKVSQNSHPKFVRLNTIIDKIPSPLSCLVICENDYVSRVVCESLENPRSRSGVIRVFSQPGVPPALAEHYRLPDRCSGLCNRPVLKQEVKKFLGQRKAEIISFGTPIELRQHFIIVVSANTPNFTDVIDTICSNQLNMVVSMDRRSICLLEGHSGQHVAILDATCEKLRPTDGRLINAADEVACRSSLFGNGKVGVIERYTFKYELSRLQLPSSKMEMVQYIPSVEKVRQKTNGENCTRRHGFELTSSEFSEYCDRLATLPQVEHGIYSKRCFSVLGESPLRSDCPFVYVPGDMPKGVLSQRLEEYMKGGDVIRKRLKRQFTYKDDLIDKKSMEFYDDMIMRLNRLLCI
ncbi:unnamed protein product [Haemonchus placei]|uniref:Uncharacterized protein n=1 Tax=Haemonchus placei TaxID=6290 RepID=A0A3P7ZFZ5_HAEPC|nr:unnamed protein product [Haemonchus placei]